MIGLCVPVGSPTPTNTYVRLIGFHMLCVSLFVHLFLRRGHKVKRGIIGENIQGKEEK